MYILDMPKPLDKNPTFKDIFDYLKRRSKKTETDCWEWQLSRVGGDYGYFHWRAANRITGTTYAHRAAYISVHEQILDGATVICHSCDNPICINPDHLFRGVQRDNIEDMWNKDRQQKNLGRVGEKNGSAKIDGETVKVIRNQAELGISHRQIAKLHGLTPEAISAIVKRKTWKHIL